MRGQLLKNLIIFMIIVLLFQRRNWPNIVFRFDMKYRWYSIDTLQITDEHKWSHTLYDLQRIARYASIPELTDAVIPSRPTHSYDVVFVDTDDEKKQDLTFCTCRPARSKKYARLLAAEFNMLSETCLVGDRLLHDRMDHFVGLSRSFLVLCKSLG